VSRHRSLQAQLAGFGAIQKMLGLRVGFGLARALRPCRQILPGSGERPFISNLDATLDGSVNGPALQPHGGIPRRRGRLYANVSRAIVRRRQIAELHLSDIRVASTTSDAKEATRTPSHA